jgi:hypothetical protein
MISCAPGVKQDNRNRCLSVDDCAVKAHFFFYIFQIQKASPLGSLGTFLGSSKLSSKLDKSDVAEQRSDQVCLVKGKKSKHVMT